jgi:hypothetical protein
MDDRSTAEQALPFARTLPAVDIASLQQLPRPTAREPAPAVQREDVTALQQAMQPAPQRRDETPTMRLKARPRGPIARMWRNWLQQPAHVAVATAATVCVLSVLVASLFTP